MLTRTDSNPIAGCDAGYCNCEAIRAVQYWVLACCTRPALTLPPAPTCYAGRAMSSHAKKKAAAAAKSAAAVRNWLKVEANGTAHMMQTDKYRLTHKLGVQTRDLRLMDPMFSSTYPSAILCRDKALVVNLEHIKVRRAAPLVQPTMDTLPGCDAF